MSTPSVIRGRGVVRPFDRLYFLPAPSGLATAAMTGFPLGMHSRRLASQEP